MEESTQEIIKKDNSNYLPVFSRYQIVLDRGEGVYLFDTDGNMYLDFLAGIINHSSQRFLNRQSY